MASTVESPQHDRDVTSAVLHDGDKTILPTGPLGGIDFGAHLDGSEVDATTHSTMEHREPDASYFTPQSGGTNEIKPVKKSNTDALSYQFEPPIPYLRKVQTGPANDSGRPQPLARSSTFIKNIMRRPEDRFEYSFDHSSDSDSSSSDDEVTNQRKRPTQPQRGLTAAEKKELKREKESERKTRPYSRFKLGDNENKMKGRVSRRDGRLNISINETSNNGVLAKALGHTIKHHLDLPNHRRPRKQAQHLADHPDIASDADSIASSLASDVIRPRLNIVIIVIGSRGDIQPFLKVGKILHHEYGHRVRIATHPTFRDFVEKETDLEFFSIGGDPAELMSYMVKNPGIVPNLQTIREGEIQTRRNAMTEMFDGMWRACTNTVEDEKDILNIKMAGDKFPFVADAIIANPPSMAHVHIAERLGIPLHIMFTFPYTPTQAFPSPLANVRPGKSNVDGSYINFMSYPLVEMMTWQGLGDIINKFRTQTLNLEPVSSLWAPGALYRMRVPYTYMWSPSLVSKPNDWGPEIDIAGFVFMDLAGNFKPPKELVDFLEAGEPPVYIGFGSIVVDDPNAFTKLILEAVKMTGVRALVNKGWGGMSIGNDNTPDNVFMLDNTPHDWLFPKCKAVVHHGGAGTTAIGLKCAKPTFIIPFFGDQPFWGAKVAEAKAGAQFCIPWKRITAEKLAEGIRQCLSEEAQINVQKMADGIAAEGDGAENACKSFHRSLPLAGRQNMRCSILEDRVAKWTLRNSTIRLSALAAEILLEQKKIKYTDLKLFRVYSWNDFDGPGEPITGTVGAVTDSLYDIGGGVGMVPIRAAKHMKQRAKHERKRQEIERRKQARKEQKDSKKQQTQPQADDQVQKNAEKKSQRPSAHREATNNTFNSVLSEDPATPLAMELAKDLGDGFKKSGAALLTMPNNLHVAVAQGFHNAPRLWGDATVRKPMRITGVKSGITAARREFGYGIYDAWTGLVTQPVGGFKDGITVPAKIVGFSTGVGKGIGGFVLKNVSAVISPPAYVGKGFIMYMKKRGESKGIGSKAYIRRAHIVQGQRDLRALREQDSPDKDEQLEHIESRVNQGWKVYQEIWTGAHEQFGTNLAGKIKLRKEKKKWEEAGALENTHAAEKALEVWRKNGDIEKHFAKRKATLEMAEKPRAPAMEQPGSYEATMDDKEQSENTYANDSAERNKVKVDGEAQGADLHKIPEEAHSDSTYVASEGGKGIKRDSTATSGAYGDYEDGMQKLKGHRISLGRATTTS